MILRHDVPPEELRARVTSKGGTTAAAIAVKDRREVKAAIIEAMLAAQARAAELAKM